MFSSAQFVDQVLQRRESLLKEAELERLINTAQHQSRIGRHFYRQLAYQLGDRLERWGCGLKHFGKVAEMSSS